MQQTSRKACAAETASGGCVCGTFVCSEPVQRSLWGIANTDRSDRDLGDESQALSPDFRLEPLRWSFCGQRSSFWCDFSPEESGEGALSTTFRRLPSFRRDGCGERGRDKRARLKTCARPGLMVLFRGRRKRVGGSFYVEHFAKRAHSAFLARFPTNMPPAVKKSVCHKTNLIFTEGIESRAPFDEPVYFLLTTRFELTFVVFFLERARLSGPHRAHASGRAFADSSRLSKGTRGKCLFAVSVCVCVCVRSWRGRARATSADLRSLV